MNVRISGDDEMYMKDDMGTWDRIVRITGNDAVPMKDDVGMIMRVRMNVIIAKTN